MGKRKPWLTKDANVVTYKLTPAVSSEPVSLMPNPELTNVVDVTEEELNEREKYGIYYPDNYNYMSHLKEKDERIEIGLVKKSEIRVPDDAIYVPTNILEVQGREVRLGARKDKRTRPSSSAALDVDADIDPELLASLDLDDMEDDVYDRLEDDFLELAGGVDMPEGRRIFEDIRKTAKALNSDDEGVDATADVDFEGANTGYAISERDKRQSAVDGAVMNPAKQELDARFNHFYEQLENSDDEAADDEEEEEADDKPVDDQLLERFAQDYIDEKDQQTYQKPDNDSKRLTLAAYARQEAQPRPKSEDVEVEECSKKARWDCESITTTYSNIYNHPTVIREAGKRKTAGLTKQTLKQLDDNMDVDAVSVRSGRSACTTRARDETTEERRERKAAIKAERRERRQERKANKTVFKEEKKRMDAQRRHVVVEGRPLK